MPSRRWRWYLALREVDWLFQVQRELITSSAVWRHSRIAGGSEGETGGGSRRVSDWMTTQSIHFRMYLDSLFVELQQCKTLVPVRIELQ